MESSPEPSENRVNSINYFISFVILFLLFLSLLDPYLSGLRYTKYFAPVICLCVLILNGGKIYVNRTTAPFLFLSFSTFLMLPFGNSYGVYDFYFYTSALFPFLVGCSPRLSPRLFFILLAFLFFLVSVPELISSGFEYSILDSRSTLESGSFAFAFGLFTVFFLVKKDWKFFLFSLLVSILVLKRISLIAIAFIFLMIYLTPIFVLRRIAMLGALANIGYVFFAFYITTDSFDALTREYLGITSSFFTMGRTVLYDSIFSSNAGLIEFFLGRGPGESYIIAAESIFSDSNKVNLHSDVLKLYYELGVLVFLIFFIMCYRFRGLGIYLLIYINFAFFTDNVSTYSVVMYVYYYLSFQLNGNELRSKS